MKRYTFKLCITKKCEICESDMMTDEYGNGQCKICKWQNNNDSAPINYSLACYPNLVSRNRAKELWAEGKPFKPTFEEFLELYDYQSELEFYYKEKFYNVTRFRGYELSEYNQEENKAVWYQEYETIEDFAANANIDGVLLKDIWDEAFEVDYSF